MANWMSERWPMSLLPAAVRWQLADSLDVTTATGLGYLTFAAELRIRGCVIYTAQKIEVIRVRSRSGSMTYDLLLDYESRGGSVLGVQRALENIGHVAAEIIPAYFESITRAQARAYPEQYTDGRVPYPFNSGYQNTEPRSCNCPECHGRGQYSNTSRPSRPNSVQREISNLNGSVYTGASEKGRRIPRRRSLTQSGSRAPDSDLDKPATAGSSGRSGRSSDMTSSENNYVPYITGQLPNMDERNNIGQNPFPRGINGEINNVFCQCEECRLRSDSEQTQRLTLESDPKTPCLLRPVHRITANGGHGHDSSRISEVISSGLSQLYLDSEESRDTSRDDVENSDETFVKSVVIKSQSVDSEANSVSRGIPTENIVTNNRGPICSRSDMGQHRLGEMVDNCPVCGNNAGAKPKTGPRPRNNSAPQKNEIPETDLRKSWHGTSGASDKEEMKKINSDSVLSWSSVTSSPQPQYTNLIGETLYSRISSFGSDNSECKRGDSGANSVDISAIGKNSVNDIYQNNLESDNANVLNNQQTGSRNIVQSNSFNCSDVQNNTSVNTPARYLSNVHSRTSFDPQVQISNDRAQRVNSTSEDAQQRGESATNAPQASGPATSAPQTSGSATSAQQINGFAASAQQNSGSNGSAQNQDRRSGDFVFVTYSWNGMTDPESLIQEVIEMCRALREAGIRVKIDMDETSYAALRLNRLDWIDRNVREARYVIVCVTPTYAADIREPDPRNQASPRSGQLNARYIFDKLREEYYSNLSQNRRIIPVMFSNYGAAPKHVPSCMRSTLIYTYPANMEEIIAAILGYGRFRPS
ncbi:uncharacterized protein LOC123537444 [Mercenaria mercenaria]|uniref:uncharacterized protein LOC123537444 n=1 Tax=Mercenaria mercenaria TaxID=6596 RepID=UPI001E1DE679|nr:uncharacterized protein LOC123537444 [Mercenaria mercenaria]